MVLQLPSGTVPPQRRTETLAGHATLDLVWRFGRCILALRWTGRCLIVPFFIKHLETHHFMDVVKQMFSVFQIPDPQLLAVIAVVAR